MTYTWKVVLAIAALHSISGDARAHLWSSAPQIGDIRDAKHRVAFATVQTKSVADEPAITLCNVNTGIAIGLDAGTCASPAAACDGVTDDRLAFVSFNRWAKATRANATGQLIEMQVSGVCKFISGNVNSRLILKGIKNIRVMGYGGTFSSVGDGLFLAGAGVCQAGIAARNGCSARLATVLAGATSVTLLNTSLCSRFVAGRWAVVTGFDLQGSFNGNYGFPPNPHYFDYVPIASTTNCASTGQIALGSALKNTYLSTWPEYSAGNANQADQGGPATIYALDSSWDTQVDIRGLTIDVAVSYAQGRSVSFRDLTMLGGSCVWPSQNKSITFTNIIGLECNVEEDKINDTIIYNNVAMKRLWFQSSSTNTLIVNGSTFSHATYRTPGITGTPKFAIISNSTIPYLQLGPQAYGVATSATCTNCIIGTTILNSGLVEKGPAGDIGTNNWLTVKSGVMSYPNTMVVTGFADNGSGAVRLTVSSTADWPNATFSINGIFAKGPNNNNPKTIKVIDTTHVDLVGTKFDGAVWTGRGSINQAAPRFAVPGANLFAQFSNYAFQVTGVTADAAGTHIATTLPGGYPNVPLSNGVKSFLAVQMPKWTCTNCAGTSQAVDFSGAAPNIPLASYSNRTWTNLPSATPLDTYPVWGKVTSIKVNVTQAYRGATTPLKFRLPTATAVGNASPFWAPFFDLRVAGLRTITPAGVTCDTGGGPVLGGCGTDTGLTLPDANAVFSSTIGPAMSGGNPTDQPWMISAEFMMDQGVVP